MAQPRNSRPINAARLIANAAKDAKDAGEIDEREEAYWLTVATNIQERNRKQRSVAAE